MKIKLFISISLLIAIVGLLIGINFSASSGNVVEENSITIGAILTLTKAGSNLGENARDGIELAISEINSAGGINGKKLNILYEDDQGDDPKSALNALHSLIFRDINIIIGPQSSSAGLSVAPTACGKNILLFSTSIGMKEFTETCGTIFSLWTVSQESSKDFALEISKKGYGNIAVINSPQAWEKHQGEVIKDTLVSEDKKVLLTQFIGTNFYTESLKIKQFEPDAIIFTNYGTQHTSAKALRLQQISVPFYSISLDQSKIDAADSALEGTVSISVFTPTEKFAEKYSKKYKEEPGVTADTAYDIIYLLRDAIEATDSTNTKDFADYLISKEEYHGASGNFEFDETGSIKKKLSYAIVNNGQLVKL